jgi:hypothetical protein
MVPIYLKNETLDLLFIKMFFSATIFICMYNPCPIAWRTRRRIELPIAIAKMSWIHVLDTSSSYECVAPSHGQRESSQASLLQGSGLVRTVVPCARRRVASGHRDALNFSNEQCEAPRGLLAFRVLSAWTGHRATSEARGEVCSLSYLSIFQ